MSDTNNSREFIVGGPGCYGFDMQIQADAAKWIAGTPEDQNPLEFMTYAEIEAAKEHAPNIFSLNVNEQYVYFSIVRNGTPLKTADEIAAYDHLM
jgi:hypothetical protein